MYIENDIDRLDTSNSPYWLQAQCRKFDSDKEQVDVTKVSDTQRKVTNVLNVFSRKRKTCVNIFQIYVLLQ